MKMANAKMIFCLFFDSKKQKQKPGFAYDISHLFVNQAENSNLKICYCSMY